MAACASSPNADESPPNAPELAPTVVALEAPPEALNPIATPSSKVLAWSPNTDDSLSAFEFGPTATELAPVAWPRQVASFRRTSPALTVSPETQPAIAGVVASAAMATAERSRARFKRRDVMINFPRWLRFAGGDC